MLKKSGGYEYIIPFTLLPETRWRKNNKNKENGETNSLYVCMKNVRKRLCAPVLYNYISRAPPYRVLSSSGALAKSPLSTRESLVNYPVLQGVADGVGCWKLWRPVFPGEKKTYDLLSTPVSFLRSVSSSVGILPRRNSDKGMNSSTLISRSSFRQIEIQKKK